MYYILNTIIYLHGPEIFFFLGGERAPIQVYFIATEKLYVMCKNISLLKFLGRNET